MCLTCVCISEGTVLHQNVSVLVFQTFFPSSPTVWKPFPYITVNWNKSKSNMLQWKVVDDKSKILNHTVKNCCLIYVLLVSFDGSFLWNCFEEVNVTKQRNFTLIDKTQFLKVVFGCNNFAVLFWLIDVKWRNPPNFSISMISTHQQLLAFQLIRWWAKSRFSLPYLRGRKKLFLCFNLL